MVAECSKYGMKPVCDHPTYCKNDKAALYLGQAGHIAYPPHRNTDSYFPSGWSSIKSHWTGLCSYTAKGKGNYALCNIPTSSHAWVSPGSSLRRDFICGRWAEVSFRAKLGPRNGVAGREYDFRRATTSQQSGEYPGLPSAPKAT